ncbi:hypothetical protein DEO72_LG2g4503 [Vigna unguiculata]|uniref:Uncharacterized protein n=1 Tax=Vigna unguiculata TaxID=3917 RepID=A0A4D6L6N0_VIGUN|nr:hypothetical protein DEO72_LG2g4503 [Vigna unguiculata]
MLRGPVSRSRTSLFQVKQWRDLLISPRRDQRGVAQTSVRERSPRRPAQIFERSSILPKRDPALLPDALFEPSPRRRRLA